jgi:RHS repeat-associated protein
MGQVGTFAATVSPGSGNYWYDWYKKIIDDPWISEGITSIPEKKIRMLDDDMTVKVEVWNLEDLGYGSATHRVTLEYPKPKPGDPGPLSSSPSLGTSKMASTSGQATSLIATSAAKAITVVWFQDYLPYGERLAGDQGGNDFAFTGKEREDTSGLYDYGARWYDPSLGRFIQLDSYLGDVSHPKTLNRYAYALNNPLRHIDPSGHNSKDSQKDEEEEKKKNIFEQVWDKIFPDKKNEDPKIGPLVEVLRQGDNPWEAIVIVHVGTEVFVAKVNVIGDNKAHVEPGQALIYVVGHHHPKKGEPYTALNLYSLEGSRAITGVGAEDKEHISGVNVHIGNRPPNPNTGSMGCFVFKTEDFAKFMKFFKKGQIGGVYFTYMPTVKVTAERTTE